MLLTSISAQAGPDRAGKWEASLQLIGNLSESTGGEEGSSVDVDSDIGFGFSVGYNLSSRFAVNFDGSFIKPDYEAVLDTEDNGLVTINHNLSVFNGQLNGVWNIMEGPLTPYVQAGFGWTYIDSNVSNGPPTTGCWWDPWWGYICSNFYDSYDDTSFSYGGGVGVRYEFGYGSFVKGSYNRYIISASGDGADPDFDIWKLEIGRMF
jgi:hypothetical protein